MSTDVEAVGIDGSPSCWLLILLGVLFRRSAANLWLICEPLRRSCGRPQLSPNRRHLWWRWQLFWETISMGAVDILNEKHCLRNDDWYIDSALCVCVAAGWNSIDYRARNLFLTGRWSSDEQRAYYFTMQRGDPQWSWEVLQLLTLVLLNRLDFLTFE